MCDKSVRSDDNDDDTIVLFVCLFFIVLQLLFKILDEFIWELVAQEDYKQLTDLVVLGFDGLTPIIEAKYGNYEQMIENGLHSQAEQVYKIYPQIQVSYCHLPLE